MQKTIQIRERLKATVLSYVPKKNQNIILVVIATLFGLYLKLRLISREFWHDEAFQVLFSSMPINFILDSNDVHPPLFNLIAKVFLYLTTDPIMLRSIILIISIFAGIAFFALMKELFDEDVATYSYFFLMLSPTFAWYSTEFRSYMFVILLTMFQIKHFNRMLRGNTISSISYVWLTVAMIYSHYMAGLILIPQIIYIFITKKFRESFAEIALVGFFCIPLLMYILNTIPKMQSFWFKDIDFVSLISTLFYTFTPPTFPRFYVLVFVMYFFIMYAFFKNQPKFKHFQLALYVFYPVIFMWIVSQFVPFFHHRYFLFGGMMIFGLAGWGYHVFARQMHEAFHYIFLMATCFLFLFVPLEYSTPLKDSSVVITDDIPIVHTSPFSQTPYKVLLPDHEHVLMTGLTKEQRFTAGGSVIKYDEVIPSEPNGSYYLVTDHMTQDGVILYDKEGLKVKKINKD